MRHPRLWQNRHFGCDSNSTSGNGQLLQQVHACHCAQRQFQEQLNYEGQMVSKAKAEEVEHVEQVLSKASQRVGEVLHYVQQG